MVINKVGRFEKVTGDEYAYTMLANEDEIDWVNYDKIVLPNRATNHSAGYDFYLTRDIELQPGESVVIETLVRCFIEPGWFLAIFPKSGLGFKYNVTLANTVGIVDADYYNSDNGGHIKVKLINKGDRILSLEKCDKFCQGVFMPYGITYDDDNYVKEERNGGFGSTGR